MSTSAYASVLAWQEALSAGDMDTLIELSSDGIELADDERGVQGVAVLYRWASETHTTLTTDRVFENSGLVATDTIASGSIVPGESDGSRRVAVVFTVSEDRVTSVFVHPDLQSAFAATGLQDGDLVED